MAFFRGFQEVFSTMDDMLFHQNTLGTMPLIHNIAWFELFTNLSLFKYAFNVIQNWEADVLQFYSMGAYFLLAVMVEGEPAKHG